MLNYKAPNHENDLNQIFVSTFELLREKKLYVGHYQPEKKETQVCA